MLLLLLLHLLTQHHASLPSPPGARRPPCIVLDELDGASGGAEGHSAVAALVKLVTGEGAGGTSSSDWLQGWACCLQGGECCGSWHTSFHPNRLASRSEPVLESQALSL